MNPRYPIYIISKGRWKSRKTARALDKLHVPYHIVIEPQEYDEYAKVIDPSKILILPFSNLGQGSIPARNWVWEHSISIGAKRHWIMDDNIGGFRRFYEGKRVPVQDGTIFRAAEDFVDRYKNVVLSGLNYTFFNVPPQQKGDKGRPPYTPNTRIYSCILIMNDYQGRWRGRYNEDTDLSIRVLKDGYCTILFNAFLCDKANTMTMKEGNTDELYKTNSEFDGRLEMAKSLKAQHPEIVRITRKWGRWQHHVDYKPFAKNKLIKIKDIEKPKDNNYGMKFVKK